jgi:hypothetical protein
MRATSIRRLGAGAAALLMLGTTLLISAGITQAAPPRWVMDVEALPAAVAPGAVAGYSVTITNNGPSNISSLYLVTKTTAAPVYVDDTQGRDACTDAGVALRCVFGALTDGQHVTVIVGYTTTGTGSFDPVFEGNTTGEAFKDPKRSHGDTLVDLDFTGTSIRSDKNFNGKFSTAPGSSVANSAQLTGSNRQATGVANLPAGVGATVEDGPGATGSCTTTTEIDCSKNFGEWSVVNVGSGGPFNSPILISITFKSGTPTAFVHSTPTSQELVKSCAETAGALPCFTWDGSTRTATISTNFNGSWRGQ